MLPGTRPGAPTPWAARSRTYDDIGNRTAQQNRTDPIPTLSVAWTYDPFGRQLARTADSVTTTYAYDLSGNKLTAASAIGTITAAYDRLNRVLTVDDEDADADDTTYTYGIAALPSRLMTPSWTDPSGSYAATLDAFDRQLSLDEPADAGASNLAWSYGTGGQVLSAAAPNGNTTAFVHDKVGHLTSKDTTAAGPTNRALYDWTWNRAGQVLTDAETITGGASNGTLAYAYDPFGQLAGSTLSGTTTAYGWDKVPDRPSARPRASFPGNAGPSSPVRHVEQGQQSGSGIRIRIEREDYE